MITHVQYNISNHNPYTNVIVSHRPTATLLTYKLYLVMLFRHHHILSKTKTPICNLNFFTFQLYFEWIFVTTTTTTSCQCPLKHHILSKSYVACVKHTPNKEFYDFGEMTSKIWWFDLSKKKASWRIDFWWFGMPEIFFWWNDFWRFDHHPE